MRRKSRRAPTALTLVGAASAAIALAAETPPNKEPPPILTDAECQVWARELSFARSVAEHDAAAFADHIHPGAAFGSSQPHPMRTRATIAEGWARIVAGEGVALHWYPTRVTIGGEGDIAWSSGPSLFETKDPKAPHPVMLGGFHSVWHRGDDGTWRVLFDDGIPSRPATQPEIAAFHAARREACPRG
ncbi:MAG TPA: DUF4440 domain-containing protein [Xanthomonadaceae bacterium]|nr:DUF4440 domain-containing protein [Xanthomonadaceae bacterium]